MLVPLFVVVVLAWGASKEGDAKKGGALFAQQCVTCHNANSNEKKLGPGLKGLFKMAKLPNGKKNTEQNIRAQIDSGGNGMPPFKDMLSDQEKDDLIAYLKTL
jgi:mono/diheme cytochrome c family protein